MLNNLKIVGFVMMCLGFALSGGGCSSHRTNFSPAPSVMYVFKPELRVISKNRTFKAFNSEDAIDALVGEGVEYQLRERYSLSEGQKINDYEKISKIVAILPQPLSMSGNPAYCGYAAYLYLGPPFSQAYKLFNNNTMIRCNFELSDKFIIFKQPNTNLNNDVVGHSKNKNFKDLLNITSTRTGASN